MSRAYSRDLRERVLRACAVGTETQASIAQRFEVSEVYRGPEMRHPAGLIQAAKGSSAMSVSSTPSWSARTWAGVRCPCRATSQVSL